MTRSCPFCAASIRHSSLSMITLSPKDACKVWESALLRNLHRHLCSADAAETFLSAGELTALAMYEKGAFDLRPSESRSCIEGTVDFDHRLGLGR